MKRLLHIILCMALLTSCYKDEILVEELDHNPFDRDYAGPSVFDPAGTYVETVTISGVQVQQQVIEIHVREELLPVENASYSIHLFDPGLNTVHQLLPDPPGSNRFKYYRVAAPAWGLPVCVEVRLANNGSTAAPTGICATL